MTNANQNIQANERLCKASRWPATNTLRVVAKGEQATASGLTPTAHKVLASAISSRYSSALLRLGAVVVGYTSVLLNYSSDRWNLYQENQKPSSPFMSKSAENLSYADGFSR